MRKIIVSASLAITVISMATYASFQLGIQWSSSRRKAIIEDQARWIARYWVKDANLFDVVSAINRDQKIGILKEEWSAGDDTEVIRGPVVDGKRIFITEGKAMIWRTAK